MKPKRVIIIDAVKREVREGTVSGLEDMQQIVGGLIERGTDLPNGDEIFVNEEALLNQPEHFFYPKGAHQPFAGSGFVTGAPSGSGRTTDCKSTVAEIEAIIEWMDPWLARRRAPEIEQDYINRQE